MSFLWCYTSNYDILNKGRLCHIFRIFDIHIMSWNSDVLIIHNWNLQLQTINLYKIYSIVLSKFALRAEFKFSWFIFNIRLSKLRHICSILFKYFPICVSLNLLDEANKRNYCQIFNRKFKFPPGKVLSFRKLHLFLKFNSGIFQ